MRVWVVTVGYDYEGDDVLGVFSSEALARAGIPPLEDDRRANYRVQAYDVDYLVPAPAAVVVKLEVLDNFGHDSEELHTCPYMVDIHKDSETLCNCCTACQQLCSDRR